MHKPFQMTEAFPMFLPYCLCEQETDSKKTG